MAKQKCRGGPTQNANFFCKCVSLKLVIIHNKTRIYKNIKILVGVGIQRIFAAPFRLVLSLLEKVTSIISLFHFAKKKNKGAVLLINKQLSIKKAP